LSIYCYWNATNIYGAGSAIGIDNPISKFGGVFYHTLDTLNTNVITIFGARPELDTRYGSLLVDSSNLINTRIAVFNYDKSIQFPGYGSASDFISTDTTNNKPLGVDADGIVYRMQYWPGSGGGTNTDSLFARQDARNNTGGAMYFSAAGQTFQLDSLDYFVVGVNPLNGVNFYDYTTATSRFGITSALSSISSPDGSTQSTQVSG